MGKSHLKIYTILLISNLCAIAIGQVTVKYDEVCTCEQLINEKECYSREICNYSNDRCSSIECNLLPAETCRQNINCVLANKECVNFKSCASHNATTEYACQQLYHFCLFDQNNQTCLDPQPLHYGTCSQNLFGSCLVGNEGLCVRKGGVCQEMTKCEDAHPSDLQCQFAFPTCEVTNTQCVSHLSCSQAPKQYNCQIAKEKINGDRFYLCTQGSKGCLNFNPKEQTKDTCLVNSYFFYHWDGQQCSKCSWDSIMKSVLFGALLILSI